MASAGLRIKMRIDEGAKKLFEELGVDIEKALNIAMIDTADKMANDANENLAESIGVNSTLFGSVMVRDKPMRKEIYTNVDYAGHVEFGTGPAKRNKKGQKTGAKRYWPPALADKHASRHSKKAGELELWRKKKGKKFKTHEDLRFAIYKKGTRPQRFMAKSLQKNRVTFARKIGKELSRQSNGKIVKR
tara:strand:+ start:1043 stop:1609 length:567 start_codon:yes stop_codon:yes gene_type:complete